MVIAVDAKIVIKRSGTALEVPTVAPTGDHTDGSWSKTDIYAGEFYLNEPDCKLYINVDGVIKELAFASGSSNTLYSADDTVGAGRIVTLTDTLTIQSGQVIFKGTGTGTTIDFKIQNSSGNERFFVHNSGSFHTGAGTNAITSATFGQTHRSSGFAFGAGFVPTTATAAAVYIAGSGNTPTQLLVISQGLSSTGVIRCGTFDNKSSSGTEHVGIYSFARNGSLRTIAGDFVAGGAGGVLSSQYLTAIRASAASSQDNLQHAIKASAQWNSGTQIYTKDLITIEATADTTTADGASTGKAVAIIAKTRGPNGSGLNMAINIPATDNNGNFVAGADASSANQRIVEITGEVEIFGNGNGFYMYQPDGTNRHVTIDNTGNWLIV